MAGNASGSQRATSVSICEGSSKISLLLRSMKRLCLSFEIHCVKDKAVFYFHFPIHVVKFPCRLSPRANKWASVSRVSLWHRQHFSTKMRTQVLLITPDVCQMVTDYTEGEKEKEVTFIFQPYYAVWRNPRDFWFSKHKRVKKITGTG